MLLEARGPVIMKHRVYTTIPHLLSSSFAHSVIVTMNTIQQWQHKSSVHRYITSITFS